MCFDKNKRAERLYPEGQKLDTIDEHVDAYFLHFDMQMINGACVMAGIVFWKQRDTPGEVTPEELLVQVKVSTEHLCRCGGGRVSEAGGRLDSFTIHYGPPRSLQCVFHGGPEKPTSVRMIVYNEIIL